MIPIVAIIGRPNVGKSTLYNRLAGKPLAIVHDEPGVTRDRHYADTLIQSRELTLVDTGGFDPGTDDSIGQGMARHVRAAIEEADLVLCVLDAQTLPAEADLAAIKLLRQSGKPTLYVANRADNPSLILEALDLHRLGIEPLIAISALHGRGTVELERQIAQHLPEPTASEPATDDALPRLALIGRPNAGKSSLLNLLSGSERSLVDARPGTTRDPVDVRVTHREKEYLVVDTAGIRRRSHVAPGVESASVLRALRTIPQAEVVVLVCDATEGIAEQDQRLLSLCLERSRAVVVALNKIDLMTQDEIDRAVKAAEHALHFASFVPIRPLSAKSGAGLGQLMGKVSDVFQQFTHRVQTSELNRFLETLLEKQPPPTHRGRAARLYYLTQPSTRPPVFVAMVSSPEHIKASYQRFVANQIRAAFGFANVPVRVHYRARRRD